MGFFSDSAADPETRPLRLGVVGCGYVGQIHARNLHDLEAVSVEAVCDVDPETAEAVAWDVGADPYDDLHEFFEHVTLDALVVATPPDVRRDVLGPAADRNWAVYVEKPPAVTLEEARACARRLRDSGDADVLVGFTYRVHPLVHRLKELIDRARITQVGTLLTLGHQGTIREDDWHYGFPPDSLHPVLVDASIHNFDLARDLVGEARRVSAAAGGSGRTTEDAVVVTSEYEGGILGVHRFSAHGDRRRFEVNLIGDGCRFHLDLTGNHLRGELEGEPVEADYDGNIYRAAMRAFTAYAADPNRTSELPDYEASLATLEMTGAADRALGSDRWEAVP